MPSVGRKLLMAGKGGLNITHAEPAEEFRSRYGAGRRRSRRCSTPSVRRPSRVGARPRRRNFRRQLRTRFPDRHESRAAAARLAAATARTGVRFHVRHRWCGWTPAGDRHIGLDSPHPQGDTTAQVHAPVVLALGGGSWARLGSDGRWFALLEQAGIALAPLRPANCGFDVGLERAPSRTLCRPADQAVSRLSGRRRRRRHRRRGEFVLTATRRRRRPDLRPVAALRDEIDAVGRQRCTSTCYPSTTRTRVSAEVARARGARSLSSHLQSRLRLKGAKVALLHECLAAARLRRSQRLGAAIKSLPLRLLAPRPLDEAISSAGGVCFEALDEQLMLKAVFPAFSAPAKCSTGKHRPAAICSPRASPAATRPAKACWPGWGPRVNSADTSGSTAWDEPPP
jgi:predicted flavoprotein YhiN